jgi:diacylglycerol kinase (ATP)
MACGDPSRRRSAPATTPFTDGPGDAIRIARESCVQGRKLVVTVGGDGTVHETVNGLVEGGGGPALGIIGTGTGGDFTKTFGIAHRLERYLEVIRDGHERRVDVGRFTYRDHEGQARTRHFNNILSMGMSGLVDQYVATFFPRVFGSTLCYAISSVRALFTSRAASVRCEITGADGEVREETFNTRILAVCNGRYFGSGMEMAPMAKPDDGRFEIVAITSKGRVTLLLGMSKIYSGRHMERADVRHYGCRRVRVELLDPRADARFLLDVDGEPLGRLPIDIEVVPEAVTLRVPKP